MNQENFINNKQLREESMNRIDVLEVVKDLLLLNGTEYANTEQVADYFGVGKEAIKTIVFKNNDELLSDGYKLLSGKETKEFLVSCDLQPTNHKGYFIVDNQKFANKNNGLFSKRSILRVAMLLRDSEVAKEIRTRLLDVVHDAENTITENGNTIVENVVLELSEEKQLMMDRIEAETNGDFDLVCVINAKLFSLKNKRIKELEEQRDRLIHTPKTYTTTEIAKEMGFSSARAFNTVLEEKKIQFKQNGTWVLYSKYAEKNLVEIKQSVLANGRVIYNTRWTGGGRDFLLSLFNIKIA